ncbi:MAG: hypothetical protein QM651_06350 [Rhodoblastus sp.]
MPIHADKPRAGGRADAFIIEIRNRTAGLVASDGREFCFFAAERAFASLDGHVFRSARQAERAVRGLAASRSGATTLR